MWCRSEKGAVAFEQATVLFFLALSVATGAAQLGNSVQAAFSTAALFDAETAQALRLGPGDPGRGGLGGIDGGGSEWTGRHPCELNPDKC